MALQPFFYLSRFFRFLILYTFGRTYLDGESARRKDATYTQNTDIYVSSGMNSRPLRSNRRLKFMPHTARSLSPATQNNVLQ
jgi:hypothetical protein